MAVSHLRPARKCVGHVSPGLAVLPFVPIWQLLTPTSGLRQISTDCMLHRSYTPSLQSSMSRPSSKHSEKTSLSRNFYRFQNFVFHFSKSDIGNTCSLHLRLVVSGFPMFDPMSRGAAHEQRVVALHAVHVPEHLKNTFRTLARSSAR